MRKIELIDAIASEQPSITKMDIEKVLDTLGEVACHAINQDEEVTIPGLVKIKTRIRDARNGINPQTGEKMIFPTKRVAKIIVLKKLKESIA